MTKVRPRFRFPFLVLMALAIAPAVYAQTFTPELTPDTIGVNTGGAGQSFQAAINHDPGFNSAIQVSFTASTVPSGLTFTPSAQFLEPPYSPITFTAQAAPGTAPGLHVVEVLFSSSQNKTINLNVYVTDGAAQPDYSLSFVPPASPIPPGGSGEFSVTVNPQNGFNSQVQLSHPNHPNLVFTQADGMIGPGQTFVFKFNVAPTASPGTILLPVYGNNPSFPRKEIAVPIQIAAAGDYTLSLSAANPPSVAQGGTTRMNLTATGVNGYTSPINITVAPPTGASTPNPAFTMTPGQTVPIDIVTTAATPPGMAVVGINAVSGTIVKSASGTFQVTAAEQPDFVITASAPVPASVRPNETASVTVSATTSGGLTSPIQVSVIPAGPVTATPAAFTLTGSGAQQTITLRANAGATPGPVMVSFNATAGTIQRSTTTVLNVLPAPAGNAPVIEAVTPNLPIPSTAQAVYLVGRNFQPGARVNSLSPGVIVDPQVIFQNDHLLEIHVTVRPGTHPGAHDLQVINPDGLSSAAPGRLIARSRDDIGAPLSVTTAAILQPVDGSIVTNAEDVYPEALLATSGTGTITGHWELCNPFASGACLVFGNFTATVGGGLPTKVVSETKLAALPWSGADAASLRLVIDNPKSVEPATIRLIFASDRASGFTAYAPEDGTEVTGAAPRFSWTLAPGASSYQVEFVVGEGRDEKTIRFRTRESWWTPSKQDLERIGPGTHRWRVRPLLAPNGTPGQPTRWLTITIGPGAIAAAKRVAQVASAVPAAQLAVGTPQGAPPNPAATNYSLAPNVTITGGKDQDTSGRASLSGQGELTEGAGASKFTGDLSYGAAFDPRRLAQESHNWVIQTGTAPERAGGDVRLGFTTPDFTDSAEYLTSGVARIGVIGRARSRFGTFSYYQPVNTALHGVVSGNQENLDIRSAAFSTPDGRKAQLRFIGLEVEDPGNPDWGTPGSRLRTFGLLGKWDVSSRIALVAEAAQGTLEAKDAPGLPSRDGTAFRIGLTGSAAGYSYGVNLRSTGANFVNPSNRGLTPGGVSDRVIGDMMLSKSFGRTSVNFTARRQEQGRSSESTLPDANQTGFNLNVSSSLGRVSMTFGANSTSDRGDGDLLTFLPETRRDQRGVNATFSEMAGRFSFSQSLNFQTMRDDVNPISDSDTTAVTVNASGQLVRNVTISANLSGTRTEADPALGTTDNWSASLQPSFAIPFASLSFQPVLSISRSTNDVMSSDSKNESLQATLQWSPNWLGSFASAQLSAGWNRAAFGSAPAATSRTYQGALTMRLSKTKGMPMFPRTTPLPGMTVPQPPDAGSSQEVQGSGESAAAAAPEAPSGQ